MYPALTSGECLQMSLNADAAILLRGSSGSWIQRTSRGTAPASTTAWDSTEKANIKLLTSLKYQKIIAQSCSLIICYCSKRMVVIITCNSITKFLPGGLI